MLRFHGVTDAGCSRQDNEDRVHDDEALGFFVVADGMGGHRHGEMAAELAISTMQYYLESSRGRTDVTWPFGYNFDLSLDANRLATAIRLANRQVWKCAERAPEFSGMGTTVAAALVSGAHAAIANVGDSRVYLHRAGALPQLTTDDTWLSAVMIRGALSKKTLANHPMRNVLTQAAGSEHDVEVHTHDLTLEPGDLLLLSTDGLHGVVGETICSMLSAGLSSGRSAEELAVTLIRAARSAGAPDNVSCVLVSYDELAP